MSVGIADHRPLHFRIADLGETRGYDCSEFSPPVSATSHNFQNGASGNNDNRQVDAIRDSINVFEYRQSQYLPTGRVNGKYLAFISTGDQVANHCVSQLPFIRGSAHDRYGLRLEKKLYIRHKPRTRLELLTRLKSVPALLSILRLLNIADQEPAIYNYLRTGGVV